jgi:hypothetical protein
MPFGWYARTDLPFLCGCQKANFLAATGMDLYKKKSLTWKEIYEFLKELLSYGDDPFEDMISEMLEDLRKETDPEIKKNMESILKIADLLREVSNF